MRYHSPRSNRRHCEPDGASLYAQAESMWITVRIELGSLTA